MTAMTIKEYCTLHKIHPNTLLFHLEKLGCHPCGTMQVSKSRPSYVWESDNLDAAKNRIKFKMVEL